MSGGPDVHILPVLQDNYCYLIGRDPFYVVIDPGAAQPVIDWLEPRGTLTHIFITHHHNDHIGGVAQLRAHYPQAMLIGPAAEALRIPAMDRTLKEGESHYFDGINPFTVIETPGHTAGHICYFAPAQKWLFSGDTLFSLGCGRLFEGTAAQMWESLQKIMVLPDDTQIYCGHEYTLSNGRFALSVDPDNEALKARVKDAEARRAKNRPTLPVTLGLEKQTNPFLRVSNAEEFAALRRAKDNS